jgi:DNA-binding MarR family transcriptional regulator
LIVSLRGQIVRESPAAQQQQQQDIKRDAMRNYLRFGKVRHYLDVINFGFKRLTKDIKKTTGISLREVKFLMQVKLNPSCSLVSVQRSQVLPSSTAAWLADNLVQKGYLQRRQNPKNRREVILDLTPMGDALLLQIDGRFITPDVEERLASAADRDVLKIEESLRTLCRLYGMTVRE